MQTIRASGSGRGGEGQEATTAPQFLQTLKSALLSSYLFILFVKDTIKDLLSINKVSILLAVLILLKTWSN